MTASLCSRCAGAARPSLRADALAGVQVAAPVSGVTVHVVPAPYIGDGRFSNNGWLQELPHPVSKIVWDNYAAIAPATAKRLGVASNDLIEVAYGVRDSAVCLCSIQPGTAEDLVTVALGYGRVERRSGRYRCRLRRHTAASHRGIERIEVRDSNVGGKGCRDVRAGVDAGAPRPG